MINLHIYPSNMANESRIFKITAALMETHLFNEIILVGKDARPLQEQEKIDVIRSIWRVPLSSFSLLFWQARKILRYFLWLVKIYFRFRRQDIGMINCHSLYDLPVGLLLKRKTHCKLIYDAHELETERNGLKGMLKKVLKIIERRCIHAVDYTFVVSDSIAQWYKDTYHLSNVSVVKNIPEKKWSLSPWQKSPILRQQFNIPNSSLVYLYQGAFLHGRGISILLAVFSQSDITAHIVFMGYGPLTQTIQDHAHKHHNIHFLPAVSHEQIISYTAGADIGFSLIENTCLSYYYCLPNKLFEYVLAGIPCIVSDFPDMRNFVEQHRCGWITAVDEASVYTLIKSITNTECSQKKQQIEQVQQDDHFGWQKEKQVLLYVYQNLFPGQSKKEKCV